jgi:hypothetical protein
MCSSTVQALPFPSGIDFFFFGAGLFDASLADGSVRAEIGEGVPRDRTYGFPLLLA